MDLNVVLRVLVTLQTVVATSIFWLLSYYNPKQKKRFQEAHEALGKKDQSPFELAAFRQKFGAGLGHQNPFENTTWLLTFYEKLKMSILAVTVFPLRVFGMALTVVQTALVAALLLRLGLPVLARSAVAWGARVLLFCFGFVHIQKVGKPACEIGVLVSNHCSFLDGFVWIGLCTPRVFAEESNFKGALMQVFAKALQIVLFDRGGSESRRMARERMASASAESCAGKAPPILVFPEGTTHNLQTVITFKDGAFAPGHPVQPALLRYKFQHCDPTWVYAGPQLPMLAFRLMCQVINHLEVVYLPVCYPSEEEQNNPHKFARRVQLAMARAMKVPVTEHSVEDLQLQAAAVKAHLPAEVGVVGFSALKETFAVDTRQIKDQMLVFREMNHDGSGLVSFEEFCDCFRRAFHEPSEGQKKLLQKFFEQLTGGQELLDFRKFLIGLALVPEDKEEVRSIAGSEEAATSLPQLEVLLDKYRGQMYVHLAFAAFAASCDSTISWKEFNELWVWLHPLSIAEGDAAPSARKTFEEITGSVGTEKLTFEMFSAYAEAHSSFEKQLRQAFFSRIATEFSPH